MKLYSFSRAILTLSIVSTLGLSHLHGAALYWDTNGTSLGAGAAPAGTWGATFNLWNSDSTGGASGTFTDTTSSADDLYFTAGGVATSGTGAYTVTVSGTQSAASLVFQSQGAATLSSGTINLGSGGIIGSATAFSGSTRGAISIGSALVLQANQSFINYGGTGLTLSGGITGTADLDLKANGTGAITFTTNKINNSGSLTNSGTGTGSVTIGSSGVAGILGANVTSLTQNSVSSMLVLSGSSSGGFAGSINILAGTLQISSGTSALLGSGTITLGASSGTANATLAPASSMTGNITNNIVVQGGNTGTATIALPSSSVYFVTGTTTLMGGHSLAITGGGSGGNKNGFVQKIVESGGSSGVSVAINGNNSTQPFSFGNINNSYTGGTVITTSSTLGSLSLGGTASGSGGGGSGNFLGSGSVTFKGFALLNQQNAAATVNGILSLVLDTDLASRGLPVTFNSQTIDLGDSSVSDTTRKIGTSGTLTFSGTIQNGSNGLTKNLEIASVSGFGGGTVVLSGISTYTGSTTITSGTLRISSGNDRLPTGTILTIKSGASATSAGTLDLNAFNQTVGGLAGDNANSVLGTVTNLAAGTGTATLTVNPDNLATPADSTFAGVIKNGTTAKVALTKNGSHALILAGANTYTGQTVVNAGSLLVASGGSISGSVSVTVAGGAAFGTVTSNVSSSSLLGSSTALNLTLGSSTGTKSDIQLNLFSSGVADAIIVSQINLSSTGNILLTLNDTTGGSLSGTYTLMTWTTSGTNFDSSTFVSQITLAGSAAGEGALSVSGNSLVFTAVPEPNSLVLVVGGFGVVFVLRRLRRC